MGKRVHGEAAAGAATKEYRAWEGMKKRCYQKDWIGYAGYGGRGIRVYGKWRNSYAAFREYILSTIGRAPSREHQIDRINNDGDYEPGNIRWATRVEQKSNQRLRKDTVLLEFGGKKLPLLEMAALHGVESKVLRDRLRKGWSVGDALLTPRVSRADAARKATIKREQNRCLKSSSISTPKETSKLKARVFKEMNVLRSRAKSKQL